MGKVIIDTDFLGHIIKANNGAETLKKIARIFDYQFVIHPWVYEREIKGIHTDVDAFVKENVTILSYEDFITTDFEDKLYDKYFKDLFSAMNRGNCVDSSYKSYRDYNKSGANLGEIHSVIMSHFTGIPLLLSDDYNAKEIAAKRMNSSVFTLDVQNSFNVLCSTVQEDPALIPYNDIISVLRNYKPEYQKARIKEFKALYSKCKQPAQV